MTNEINENTLLFFMISTKRKTEKDKNVEVTNKLPHRQCQQL